MIREHVTYGTSPRNGCYEPTEGVPLGVIMDRKLVEGIIRVRNIISPYTFLPTILLRVTPSAKRNSYRVATPYYIYPG